MQGTSVSHLNTYSSILIHTENQSSFACNQNIKELTSYSAGGFLFVYIALCNSFETKRNDIPVNKSFTKTSSNTRVISAEELGTTSKNNVAGRITLVRASLWGLYSLTLIISCSQLIEALWHKKITPL